MGRSRPRFVVPAVGDGAHHRRIVKANRLLDEGEALFGFFHLRHVLGVVARRLAGHGEADASVVGADAVPDLAAEQFIYRRSRHLPGDVPQRDFDRAHRRTPGLEGAHPTDLQHDAIHVRRIFAQEIVLIEEHHRLEIRFRGLGLPVPGDALIRHDANYRVPADYGAPEVRDPNRCARRALIGERQGAALLSRPRRSGRRSRDRPEKSPSRPIRHEFLL